MKVRDWMKTNTQPSRCEFSSMCMRIPFQIRSCLGLGTFIFVASIVGCAKYPAVSTRESQDFIKQVYTACNTQNVERLTACETKLTELKSAGHVSEAEHTAFSKIIATAKQSDWSAAQSQALRYAQDQVR